MRINIQLSTVFHPQTNGQSKMTIYIFKGILRANVIDFRVGWSKYLSLIEFAYNNSYQTSINITPCEALYN